MTLLSAAHELAEAGCSVIPVTSDGRKRPAVQWKSSQSERADARQLEAWFTGRTYEGLGIVTGSVSGELEMFEVEGRAISMVPELAQLMADNGFGELWQRLCGGWLEQSPSGGLHWLYRVDGPARPNTKLARRPNSENPQLADVLIETRGEGGYTVTAPSHGHVHPTGKPWVILTGGPGSVPLLSIDERDALYAIASILDEMPVVAEPVRALRPAGEPTGTRPGDDFNERATWEEILTPEGWQRTKHFGGNCWGWIRPGKDRREGISATTGRNDGDNLFVFSTSTTFEDCQPYSKFAAYALLHHGGDYSSAAKALRAEGYGKPAEQTRPAADLADLIADATPISDVAPPVSIPREPTTYTATDDGNALRLVDTHGGQIRYCPQAGSWLRWDGHRWAWDVGGRIHELARGVARDLPTGDKGEVAFRSRSLSNNGLKGMVNVARTDNRILVDPDHLDGRPYELNTPTGVIDLRTGDLRDPDPAALHTRSTPIAPDFEAPRPRWDKFLADTFAGDPALTTYIQRLLGLSLIGEHLEQLLPFGWGSGANGKSTLLNVIQGVVGTGQDGYSIPAPAELLLATHQRSHPTELARLSGARLVVASELEDGERFAESRIKMLTGGEHIAARFMGRDFFSFKPTHTIWLLANDQPAVRAGGPAFWRRLRLLPFIHVVPTAERIAGLDQQLINDEGPAILAWAIRGAVDYLTNGLAEPTSVRVATNAYEHDQDTVARFVEDRCERGAHALPHMTIRVAELRNAYENWCRIEGETPVSAKALTGALTSRFDVIAVRSSSSRLYAGIRLVDLSLSDDTSVTEESDSGDSGWWNR